MGIAGTLSQYDAVACAELARRATAPAVVAVPTCESTMDLAHDHAAAGAGHGTVIVAEEQRAGRGRTGKAWLSEPESGVWASVIVRPASLHGAVSLLSLRTGLALAARLDAHAAHAVQLKWPNDLLLAGGKLAGILTEARWRGEALEWVVVGVGVNVRAPRHHAPQATALPIAPLAPGTRCADVLVAVAHAVLDAAARAGTLSDVELDAYAARDAVAGRAIRAPLRGIVRGVDADGALVVQGPTGVQRAVAGSLEFDDSPRER